MEARDKLLAVYNPHMQSQQLLLLEQRLRQALVVRGSDAELHAELGRVLAAQLRFRSAVSQFELALGFRPADARILADLGRSLLALYRVDEILPWYERAIAAAPDDAEILAMLGGTLFGLGRHESAQQALEKAVALAPQTARTYAALADVRPLTGGEIDQLKSLLATAGRDEAAAIHFTLAKAAAENGDHDQSFGHQQQANRLMRQGFRYDEAGTLGSLEALKSVFSPALMAAQSGHGERSEVPVFVVGLPRSGSTLVEQVLASHPQVAGIGEDRAFTNQVVAIGKPYPAMVPDLSRRDLKHLGAAYVAAIRPASPTAARIVNKMPVNFLFAGLIHLVLPRARIIHVVRNAVDTCLSCFAMPFGPAAYPYLCDFAEMGRYYRAYRDLMAHWTAVLPPGVMIEVRYEDLIADLEPGARRMIAHLGLEWDPACLSFHHNPRAVWTASAVQVRQPLFNHRRWRPEANDLEPLLTGLGPYASA